MNKLISTAILTIFMAVCSFGAAAGSDSDKNKETMRKDAPANTSTSKKEDKSGSASDKGGEATPEKSLSEREKEYKDQEVMDKKPYKQ